uniref:GAG-pre-integrase domain-containing protein n=1 Tax=Chenopodium quinoa TaxID=63459 RepID=A0A803N1U1_CHEQI
MSWLLPFFAVESDFTEKVKTAVVGDASYKNLKEQIESRIARRFQIQDGLVYVKGARLYIPAGMLRFELLHEDSSLRNLIGAGEQCDGVYIFRLVRARNPHANKVVISDASLLWYKRLGHPSMQVWERYLANPPIWDDVEDKSFVIDAENAAANISRPAGSAT